MPLPQYVARLRVISQRRFVVLDSGHMGIVPNHAVVGDQVTILLGCSVPILIRAVDKAHTLVIGESYFHGVMDGESMKNGVVERVTLI
jgi:hypothetical protein